MKNVWPAQIALAGDLVEGHVRILDDLAASEVPRPVVDSMLRAWVHNTPTPVLAVLAGRLRPLIADGSSRFLEVRARLEGRLALQDPRARVWLEEALLRGHSSNVAGTAVKTLQDHRGAWPPDLVRWLVSVLGTPHTDAAMRLTTILANDDRVGAEALAAVTSVLLETAIRRMRLAVEGDEDANLVRSLLTLIIRVDTLVPLSRDLVNEVYSVTRARLVQGSRTDESGRCSAALRDLSTLCGSLLPGRFSREEIRELLTELLTTDVTAVGRKIRSALAVLLTGVGRRDPGALDWLEELFGDPNTSPGTQDAIANAVLSLDGAEAGGRAARLRAHPACPPDVATFILNALSTAL